MQKSLLELAAANPTYTVVITGHSLGAAAAALAAVDYYEQTGGSKAVLYTFGQPRVGDYDFAKTVNKHTQEGESVGGWVCVWETRRGGGGGAAARPAPPPPSPLHPQPTASSMTTTSSRTCRSAAGPSRATPPGELG